MPGQHARLSASSADRWIHCTGSVALSEQAPPKGDTFYTQEGTVAHTLADIQTRTMIFGAKSLTKKDKEDQKDIIQNSGFYTEEMGEAVATYAAYIQELYNTAGPGAALMTEQRLDLTRWVPEGFGTADCCILGNDTLYVVDFKFGKGVAVNAENNPQIRLYGLGAVDLFDGLYEFSKVNMTIIQPRLGSISSEEMPLNDLLKWGEEVVKPQAEKAMDGCQEFASGSWCRFCPCHPICREQAKLQVEIAKHDFGDPLLMDSDEIAEVLQIADKYVAWVNALKEYALSQALRGEHFEGYKIVEGRSNRTYRDELLVKEALNKAGFDDALIYERRMLGITAMEKVVGKKQLTEILGDLLIKPEGKPVLVPESDKREPLDPAQRAKQDFAEFDEL